MKQYDISNNIPYSPIPLLPYFKLENILNRCYYTNMKNDGGEESENLDKRQIRTAVAA